MMPYDTENNLVNNQTKKIKFQKMYTMQDIKIPFLLHLSPYSFLVLSMIEIFYLLQISLEDHHNCDIIITSLILLLTLLSFFFYTFIKRKKSKKIAFKYLFFIIMLISNVILGINNLKKELKHVKKLISFSYLNIFYLCYMMFSLDINLLSVLAYLIFNMFYIIYAGVKVGNKNLRFILEISLNIFIPITVYIIKKETKIHYLKHLRQIKVSSVILTECSTQINNNIENNYFILLDKKIIYLNELLEEKINKMNENDKNINEEYINNKTKPYKLLKMYLKNNKFNNPIKKFNNKSMIDMMNDVSQKEIASKRFQYLGSNKLNNVNYEFYFKINQIVIDEKKIKYLEIIMLDKDNYKNIPNNNTNNNNSNNIPIDKNHDFFNKNLDIIYDKKLKDELSEKNEILPEIKNIIIKSINGISKKIEENNLDTVNKANGIINDLTNILLFLKEFENSNLFTKPSNTLTECHNNEIRNLILNTAKITDTLSFYSSKIKILVDKNNLMNYKILSGLYYIVKKCLLIIIINILVTTKNTKFDTIKIDDFIGSENDSKYILISIIAINNYNNNNLMISNNEILIKNLKNFISANKLKLNYSNNKFQLIIPVDNNIPCSIIENKDCILDINY